MCQYFSKHIFVLGTKYICLTHVSSPQLQKCVRIDILVPIFDSGDNSGDIVGRPVHFIFSNVGTENILVLFRLNGKTQ